MVALYSTAELRRTARSAASNSSRVAFSSDPLGSTSFSTPASVADVPSGSVVEFGTVRVAAVQATPVILDAEATVDKAIDLIGEAAAEGAALVVFPECFVSRVPDEHLGQGGGHVEPTACDELWERMWASSVDVDGPHVDRLAKACAEHGVHVAIGVNEREDHRPGTLYNALLVIGPDGLLHRHRKLMPTMHERVFHGVGAGDDLDVVDAARRRSRRRPHLLGEPHAAGPLGGVPGRARRSGWRPTADDSEGWLASMRHIAIEAGAFVVERAAVHPRVGLPRRLPAADRPTASTCIGRGGACIVDPNGEVHRRAALRRRGHRRRRLRPPRRRCTPSGYFDVAGHYGRADVLDR